MILLTSNITSVTDQRTKQVDIDSGNKMITRQRRKCYNNVIIIQGENKLNDINKAKELSGNNK